MHVLVPSVWLSNSMPCSADVEVRRVSLKDIGGIFPGELEGVDGLKTPLDDLCATLAVKPKNEMVTFRLEHINARDTFVMCMLLFAQSQGAEMADIGMEAVDQDEEEEEAEETHEEVAGVAGGFASGVGSD